MEKNSLSFALSFPLTIFADNMTTSILITGASGFIGSFLVEQALNKGWEVYAAVRKTSSRQYLTDQRIHFIEIDLSSEQQLHQALSQQQFQYVIHAAGLTKCKNTADFYRVNTQATERLCKALLDTQHNLQHFVFISSLSVMGAIKEQLPHTEVNIQDEPKPNTHYAKSKLQAEHIVKTYMKDVPTTILRPTGVYGPREKDYLLMAQSIRRHIDFSVGYKPQHITFIYVKDVVQAAYKALKYQGNIQTFLLTDDNTYTSKEFSMLLQREMKVKRVIHIKAPLWVLKTVCAISEQIAKFRRATPTLNMDKYRILKQRNWMADITPAKQQLMFQPEYNLEKGVQQTVKWYKEQGWL